MARKAPIGPKRALSGQFPLFPRGGGVRRNWSRSAPKRPICPEKARFRREDFPPIFSENLGLKPPLVSPPLDFPNSRVFFSFLPFLLATPLPPPFLGTFLPFSPPRKVLCSVEEGAQQQSLERGSFRMDLSRKFGKEIPSRDLRKKRSVLDCPHQASPRTKLWIDTVCQRPVTHLMSERRNMGVLIKGGFQKLYHVVLMVPTVPEGHVHRVTKPENPRRIPQTLAEPRRASQNPRRDPRRGL